LIMPLTTLVSFWVQRLSGQPVPNPQISMVPAVGLGIGFFVGASGEELGWSAYAIDPLEARWGALLASFILGAFGVVYHYPGLAGVGRSLTYIAWWSVWTISGRVIIVWLYEKSGKSALPAVLFHMTINLTWQLFPVNGSYWDPEHNGLLTALAAALVLIAWRPRSPAAYRYTEKTV
jgi:CAAX protease family protein